MNCNFHPDVPSVAYCQFCGKALCKDCVRNVGGSVYCESCLAERLRGGMPTAVPPVFTGAPHPMLAGLLGFIPGVGAMYNGQYAKAIAHVVIFAVLASLGDKSSIFGILVAAWVFYQVFDAYQTAIARRDGLPLPNPFGLNDIAQRLGIHPHPGAPIPPVPPVPPVPPTPGAAGGWGPTGGPQGPTPGVSGFVPPAGYGVAPGQPFTPYAPYPPPPPVGSGCYTGRDIPTGAIILIGLGILFLFGSLGLLHEDWVSHGWPLLIIGLGVWIIFRRTRGVPPPPPDPASIHSPGHTHSVPTDTTGGPR